MKSSFRLIFLLFISVSSVAYARQGSRPSSTEPAPNAQNAQQKDAQPDTGVGYSIKSYSEEVMVDVVVTDSHGAPVTDLTNAHFKVYEDGKLQKFRYFQENGNAKTASDPAAVPVPKLPAHVYSNIKAPGPTVILLMDALNTPMADQMYARNEVKRTLQQLPAGSRIALFALTPSLHQIVGLTTDPEVVAAALNKNKGFGQPFLFDDLSPEEKEQIASAQSDQIDSTSPQTGVTEARRAERKIELRAGYTLEAFKVLGKYLGGFTGRKSILWFSGSFPLEVVPQSMTIHEDTAGMGGGVDFIYADFSEDIRHASALLARSRVAVYPVDVRGVIGDLAYSAVQGPLLQSSGSPSGENSIGTAGSVGTDQIRQQQTDFAQSTSDEHASMAELADATGGHAFFNTNDLSGIAQKALGDAASYYEIAYVPDHARFDEKYHKIVVKLDMPNLKATYRKGYFADDPDKSEKKPQAPPDPLHAALRDAAPESTEIKFVSTVLPIDPQPDLSDPAKRDGDFGSKLSLPITRYAIDWNINLDGLKISTSGSGTHQGEVTFAVVVYDSAGKTRNSRVNTLKFDLNEQRFAYFSKVGLPIHQEIDLPEGNVILRLAVTDPVSGKTGSLEIPLQGNTEADKSM